MHIMDEIRRGFLRGRITVWQPQGLVTSLEDLHAAEVLLQKPNQIQYEWGAIAAQCIGMGNRNYRVNAMYIEYENVANPDDPITVPTYGRDEGRSYYEDLAMSPNRDFLRVPLLFQPSIGIEAGFEDYFTAGVNGNKLTFYTQSQGTAGFHGKAFNSGSNSKVFGVALIATPVFGDPTQDLIFARTYFEVADQTPKLVSSQVGITWDVAFE